MSAGYSANGRFSTSAARTTPATGRVVLQELAL
jgi:hypothetical protein